MNELDESYQALQKDGVVILSHVLNKEEQNKLLTAYNDIKDEVEEIQKNQPPKERIFFEDGVKVSSLYWPIGATNYVMQAGRKRWDTHYRFQQGVFLEDFIRHNPRVEALLQKVLPKHRNHLGGIHGYPGSEHQYWHRDATSLFNDDKDSSLLTNNTYVEDYYFTVLFPLVDLNDKNGSTEFMLGSHMLSREELKDYPTTAFDVKKGDAIIFNGKINHRGRGNQSKQERPVIYNVYYKPWYNDHYREGVTESSFF